MSLGAGGTYPWVKKDDYIPTAPGWPNDHYAQDNVKGAPVLAFGIGSIISRLDQELLPYVNVGFTYTHDFYAQVDGHINQYSMPSLRNYNYKYDIHRQTLLGVMKLDLINYYNFMPYFAVGLGYSFNKASNYSESPLNGVTPRVSPGFNGTTNGYFSYTLGAGIDYIASSNVWVSLDYYYGNFGDVKTSTGDNPATLAGNNYRNAELKSKLTANTVLVTFTFLTNKI
jgi:opacity protein-like surface antigen